MNTWIAYAQGDEPFPGLEIDLVEGVETKPKVGDKITIEWVNKKPSGGLVKACDGDTLIIESGDREIEMRPANDHDPINPAQSGMTVNPYIVL